MKKIIFAFGIFTFLFSCSSNKNLNIRASVSSYSDESKSNVQSYKSKYFVSQDMAEAMIGKFKNHKLRGFLRDRKKLDSAYSIFEPALLKQIIDDYANVASLKFVMAAGVDKNAYYGAPFILLRVQRINNSPGGSVKEGAVGNIRRTPAPEYYKPMDLCPLPYGGCKLSSP